MREPDGAPRQIFGVVHDITGRKRAEEALIEQSGIFDAFFENTVTPLAFLDKKFNFVRVNKAYAKAGQRDISEFPGHNHFDFYPSDARAIFERVVETKEPFQTNARPFIYPDHPEWGVTYWDWILTPITDNKGEVEYLVFSLNDVTQSRRAEEMVRRSERNLAEAQRLAHIGSHEYDVLNDRLYWSDEVFCIFGISPEDFTGKASDFFDRIHPDDRENVKMTIEEAIEQRKKGEFEHRIILPDSTVRIVHERFEAIYDENGQKIRHIGTIQDITERKQAESLIISQRDLALSLGDTFELEEGFHRFLDKAIHVSEMDCGGIYLVDESSGALDLVYHTGLPPAFVNSASHYEADCASVRLVMKGKPISTRYHELDLILPEDRLREQLKAIAIIPFHYEGHVIGCLNIASHTLDEVPAFAFKALELLSAQLGATIARLRIEKEIRELNAKLEKRVEERTGELTQSQKALLNMVDNLNKSMELLRESEERYRMLVEYSPDGIMVHDTEKFTYANKAASDILGASNPEELIGKTILEIIHPDYRETVSQRLLREKEGKEASLLEQKLLRMDGTPIDVEVVAFPIRYGDRIEVHSVVRDITERKKAMDAIKAANLRLIELDRLKSIFLATMSHELRTPLNSIIGFTGIILQGFSGPLSDEQKKQLEIVKSSGNHLLSLINDVLDISKIEAGQLKIEKAQFEMRKAIETVVQIMTPLADKQGLALHVDVGTEVGVIVSDHRRVEQILLNLLSNAIKFTEKGTIKVECHVSDGQVITRVIDTGIGIKPDNMINLFIPFVQLENGLTRRFEGTGLGLSISKKLVEMLGGSIIAQSEFGKGSVFTFILPLKRDTT